MFSIFCLPIISILRHGKARSLISELAYWRKDIYCQRELFIVNLINFYHWLTAINAYLIKNILPIQNTGNLNGGRFFVSSYWFASVYYMKPSNITMYIQSGADKLQLISSTEPQNLYEFIGATLYRIYSTVDRSWCLKFMETISYFLLSNRNSL